MIAAPTRTECARTTTACRLCAAALDADDAVMLRVPRGVHYFLRSDELAADAPVTLRIVTCNFCGHLQSLDEAVIYGNHASSASYVSAPLRAARQAQAERTFAYAAVRPRRVLELGCGDGDFLATLRPSLEVAVGIEPSPAAAARAAERGIRVERALLAEDTSVPGGPFDAFFAFHVLEHVPDVRAFLRGIRRNLTTTAVGCIEVPSSEAAYECDRFGHFMADHLSYFFGETLRTAVEAGGFEIVALERDWNGEHLVAYVRVRRATRHHDVPGWVAASTGRLATFLEAAALEGRSVALWGASNAILPVLMQLPAHLAYIVVDKAPTKHGRHAPGSHVAVRDPGELRRRRIDDVVITAPRFAAEIEAELATLFDVRIDTVARDVGVANSVCRLTWPVRTGD